MVVCGVYEHVVVPQPNGIVADFIKKLAFWNKHGPQ